MTVAQSLQVFASSASMDASFDTGIPLSFDSIISCTAAQTDGKLVIGGQFTTYQGISSNYIARLNIDGTRDTTFDIGNGFDGQVSAISIESGGKILVAGYFSSYNGQTANGIIRLNSDGSRDDSFVVGNGFNGAPGIVYAIVIEDDGNILVGGSFSSYKGVAAKNIIRLTETGSRDSSFNIGNGFNNQVTSIKKQNDGGILVGGFFTSYNGEYIGNVVRLNRNGYRDTSFSIGELRGDKGATQLKFINIQDDGKILIGGKFQKYNGTDANNIVRLNSDGTIDSSFIIGNGFDNQVNFLQAQSDGKIFVGGLFTNYNGISANKIILLNSDGSRDNSFAMGNGFDGYFDEVYFINPQTNGKIFVSGYFGQYNGITSPYIICLNNDGSKNTHFSLGNGISGNPRTDINTIQTQSDRKIIIGGRFTTYKGTKANNIMRLTSSGIIDETFISGEGFDNQVFDIKVQPDGKILVGGGFYSYNGRSPSGQSARGIIRLNSDGTRDINFNVTENIYNISSIQIQNDNKILISAGTDGNINKVIRLNSDGSKDTSFDVLDGFNDTVSTMALQADGKILIGGNFTTFQGSGSIPGSCNDGSSPDQQSCLSFGSCSNYVYTGKQDCEANYYCTNMYDTDKTSCETDGGSWIKGFWDYTYSWTKQVNHIIRLNSDGSTDNTFDIGNGFDGVVNTISVQSGGKIIVGGAFYSYNGNTANNLIGLNDDGSINNAFIIGDGFDSTVYSILIQSGGKIFVGGQFNSYNGKVTNDIAFLNSDGSKDDSFDSLNGFNGFGGYIRSIAIGSDGKVVVGGPFTTYNGTAAPYLISLYGDSSVVALPNSIDIETINSAFTTQGYTTTNGTLNGSTPISLSGTDGNIPSTLNITNQNVNIIIPGNTQIKQSDTTTNYSGVISVPVVKTMGGVNNEHAIIAFNIGSSSNIISLTGGYATISIPVPGQTIGDSVNVYYSPDNGVSWYFETTTQVINKNGEPYVEFSTNHLGYFAVTNPAGGSNTNTGSSNTNTGSSNITPTDNGSSSSSSSSSHNTLPSTIDGVGDILHGAALHESGSIIGSPYSTELNNSYLWAFGYDITTMNTIQKANMEGKLIRKDMAKMISNFAINVLKKVPSTGSNCTFSDTKSLSEEAKAYISLSCKLGLMGFESNGTTIKKNFDPLSEVDRGQFGTILSRLLRAGKYNGGDPYYTKHLNALKTAGIMTKIATPLQKEIRGFVMLMMMRATAK